jgi:glycosyltransferase involved in cell wall biosynthesis
MKILYVIGCFYPSQIGGPCNAISWLVKEAKKNNVETTVVSTMMGIEHDKLIRADEWIYNEYGKVIYHSYSSRTLPLKMIVSSIKEVKNHDIVHLNSIFHPPCIIVAVVAMLLGKVIFWDPGGELSKHAIKYGRIKKTIFLFFTKILVHTKPYFHTTSKDETNDVKRWLGPKSRIFESPNYIELKPRLEASVKKQFLFIGRIHPIKAIENLIEAISISSELKKYSYRLIIAGDANNDYGKHLKQMTKDLELQNVIDFIGHLEGKEKCKIYAESYFMILPSHSENFANVVTESLTHGTPVIASTGTPWKLLEEESCGFYTPNNPVALAKAIDRAILLNQNEYTDFRNRARNLLLSKFSIEQGIFEWLKVYEDALKAN